MKLPIYALLGITTLTIACGPDDGEKITTSQVHQIVAANTENAVNTTLTNGNFLEESNVLESMFGAAMQTCEPASEDSVVGSNCEPDELGLELGGLKIDRAELADYLKQTVFKETNVESSNETEITYLIDGKSICGEADPMFPSDCITDVDKAQIRLRVTSPEEDAVDIDLLIGPDRDNPFSAEFHSNLVAAEIDLDGIDGALEFLESLDLIEDGTELPKTFKGRVRGEVKVDGPNKVSASLSVLRDIDVAGGDYGLKVGANEPTVQVTLDGAAKALSFLVDVGEVDLRTIQDDKSWEFNLAGLDGQATLDAQSDSVTITGLGFGDAQSTIKIDGKQALSLDFNADSDRHIDLVVIPSDNGVKIDLEKSLNIALGLNLPDAEASYLKDDVLNIEFEGDKPSLILTDAESMKVEAGTLKVSLEKAGSAIEVAAGQCMQADYSDEPTYTEGETITESNAIEEMSIVDCE